MATRAELLREIKRLRGVAESQFSRIDTAIQKGRLPKSAKGTYFYQEYEQRRRVGTSDVNRKLPKLKNAELEKVVSGLTKLVEQETATQKGIRERLREQERNAEIQLNIAGLDEDQIAGMSRYQKSKFFQLAKMIMEELDYESDAAFETVAETMKSSGKKASTLFREYSNDSEKFIEKYEL